jgi:branched-chain amino acid transport system permease protein
VTTFGNLTIGGLASGGMYAMFALGIVLLFRTAGLLNLAVGDFAMLGGLGTAALVYRAGLPFAAAAVIVLAAVGAFAYAYDRLVLSLALDRRQKGGPDGGVTVFFFTIALSFFIENAGLHMFGSDVGAAPAIWPGPPISLGGIHVQRAGLIVLLVAIVVGVGFAAYLRYSLNGKALSAAGQNPFGARVVGMRQAALRRRMWVGLCILAAIFGIVVSPLTGFTYNSTGELSLFGLMGAALAGFTRPGRAVLVGVAIGLAETYLGGYVSSRYQDALLNAALVLIVLVRPQILGHNPITNE